VEIVIGHGLLEAMLEFAKDNHPREAIVLLRGKHEKDMIEVTDFLLPPYAATSEEMATFPVHMLPIDFTIMGTAHSHPSGVLRLSVVDEHNFYGRITLIMGHPYTTGNVAAFNKAGDRLQLRVRD
jgi:proteasome lid subunit RPN8/RPN11